MNTITIRGDEGAVVWGYQTAAALGSWTLSGESLTATVKSHDAFRTSQPSLMFRVTRPNGIRWEWRIAALQIAGSTLQATLLQE